MCAFGVLLSSGDLTVPCKVQNLPRRGEHLAVRLAYLEEKKGMRENEEEGSKREGIFVGEK